MGPVYSDDGDIGNGNVVPLVKLIVELGMRESLDWGLSAVVDNASPVD